METRVGPLGFLAREMLAEVPALMCGLMCGLDKEKSGHDSSRLYGLSAPSMIAFKFRLRVTKKRSM